MMYLFIYIYIYVQLQYVHINGTHQTERAAVAAVGMEALHVYVNSQRMYTVYL